MEAQQFLKTNPTGDYLTIFQFDLKEGEIQASNFEWEEAGKEFKYNNSMYDVVSIQEHDKKMVIYCFNDSGESELEKHLDEIHQKQNDPKASSTEAFQKLISLSFESVKHQNFYLSPSKLGFKFKGFKEAIIFNTLEVTVPPPDELIES
jgi:hypothetical protein